MRPIDADALKKAIELICEDERTNMTAIAYFALLELVDTMPTIEAEFVKHGRWVKSDTQKHVEITYECSECQHEVVGEYEKTPFCGGCGVRMDGNTDNNVRNLTDEETAIYESWIESEAKDTDLNIMGGDGE